MTSRLHLKELSTDDAPFLFELLNTEEWKQNIGDRHIRTLEDAVNHAQKIIANPAITYWTVFLKEDNSPLGVLSFIQREYLDHPDIGFAFLPRHMKKGYAYEAASEILQQVMTAGKYPTILATTVPANTPSIALLEKLGFRFARTQQVDGEELKIYALHSQSQ